MTGRNEENKQCIETDRGLDIKRVTPGGYNSKKGRGISQDPA